MREEEKKEEKRETSQKIRRKIETKTTGEQIRECKALEERKGMKGK